MKINVKTKKVQEIETVEEKEIDLEKLIKVFKSRYKADTYIGSDMISIPKEAVEDTIAVLSACIERDEMMKNFKERIPEEMDKEIKVMAAFLALSGITKC